MRSFCLFILLAGLTIFVSAGRAQQYGNGIKAIVQSSVITLAEVEQYAKPAAEALIRDGPVPATAEEEEMEEWRLPAMH